MIYGYICHILRKNLHGFKNEAFMNMFYDFSSSIKVGFCIWCIWVCLEAIMFNSSCVSSVLRLGFHKCWSGLAKRKDPSFGRFQNFGFCMVRASGGIPARAWKSASQQFWKIVQSARADKVALEGGTYFRKFWEVELHDFHMSFASFSIS
mgnify:CR=1 FL=1